MRTLVLDPPPPELTALLERRKRLGLDHKDEVWEGVLHVVPSPSGRHGDLAGQLIVILDRPARDAGLFPSVGGVNIGAGIEDFRVPDGSLHRTRPREVWFATVALAIEIVSPGDETWEKLPFYAAHQVDELLIVDPDECKVHWLALADDGYEPIERSGLIALGAAGLEAQIDWP